MTIIFKISHGSELHIFANQIFGADEPSVISLNRLAQITLLSICMTVDKFPSQCGYILQFIGFIDQSSIVTLFSSILNPENEQTFHAQTWLANAQFAELLSYELRKTQITNCILGSGMMERYHNILEIIRTATRCPLIADTFTSNTVIEAILEGITRVPPELVADSWNTLTDLATQKTVPLLHTMLETAVLILENSNSVSRASVHLVGFLSKMLDIDPDCEAFLEHRNVLQSIMQLAFTKQNHSFLQSAIVEYIKSCFKHPALRVQTVAVAVTPLIYADLSPSMQAMTYQIVELVLAFADKDFNFRQFLLKMPGFNEYVTQKYQPRKEALSHKYGGKFKPNPRQPKGKLIIDF